MTDWVMVPREPTPEMCAAGFCVSEAEHDPAGVYRAMLSAVPQQQAEPVATIQPEQIVRIIDQKVEPVAYVIRSLRDGSIRDEIAPVGWRTFDYKMAKLREEPWVKNGIAEIVPLYTSPRITAAQVEQIKRLADEYAHVYSFVKGADMPIARAALHAALDALVKEK